MTTEVWDGAAGADAGYTVVHVLISNMGDLPVRLAPGGAHDGEWQGKGRAASSCRRRGAGAPCRSARAAHASLHLR